MSLFWVCDGRNMLSLYCLVYIWGKNADGLTTRWHFWGNLKCMKLTCRIVNLYTSKWTKLCEVLIPQTKASQPSTCNLVGYKRGKHQQSLHHLSIGSGRQQANHSALLTTSLILPFELCWMMGWHGQGLFSLKWKGGQGTSQSDPTSLDSFICQFNSHRP